MSTTPQSIPYLFTLVLLTSILILSEFPLPTSWVLTAIMYTIKLTCTYPTARQYYNDTHPKTQPILRLNLKINETIFGVLLYRGSLYTKDAISSILNYLTTIIDSVVSRELNILLGEHYGLFITKIW